VQTPTIGASRPGPAITRRGGECRKILLVPSVGVGRAASFRFAVFKRGHLRFFFFCSFNSFGLARAKRGGANRFYSSKEQGHGDGGGNNRVPRSVTVAVRHIEVSQCMGAGAHMPQGGRRPTRPTPNPLHFASGRRSTAPPTRKSMRI